MNYLAHAYLSFNRPQVLVGNMISDFVKGRKRYDYPEEIQKGIHLHRMIDEFTDSHPSNQLAKSVFRPHYGLYAGAFVDVAYDHFVANDPALFINEDQLTSFAAETYSILETYMDWLPERFRQLLPYMQQQNWLYHYRFTNGIHKSFGGLVRRARYIDSEEQAIGAFNNEFETIQQCYHSFFPSLSQFAVQQLDAMDKA